ncbi:MAG: glutamate 5-kinase [Endomicrobiales bacterium]
MRIVVKVGTNLLTSKDGALDRRRIAVLAGELSSLKSSGCHVVLVSSGAIGAGMGRMGLRERPSSLRDKQALAAIGQPLLMDAYQESFRSAGVTLAQVLLTRQDFDDRARYINARSTLQALLEMGVVPIINENDTVAVEEINFGDNDTLAALVAATVNADYLFLLTDVDGLYKGVPGKSELIPVVEKITPEIEEYASGKSGSGKGVGGMKTKLSAARTATSAGVKMVIANGADPRVISRILGGEKTGTTFLPGKALEPRKCWIAFGTRCRGRIIIDDGAVQALVKKGKSLLPSGIVAAEGTFGVGDAVAILGVNRREIGRGLTYYSSSDIDKIKGKRSSEITKILPRADFEEAVHRDNLVLL